VHRVCWACGARTDDDHRVRCDCGEPLRFDIDAAGFELGDAPERPGLWQYGAMLPVDAPEGLAAAAGDTPLVRSERLDPVAGCRVAVKYETENPTGSYKDRGSAVAVTLATRRGVDAVGTVSYGNMAMSTAAHAASLDRECVALVPSGTPEARLALIARYGPTVLRVDEDYRQLYDDVLDLRSPVAFFLSDPPARISGYKTCVFEVIKQASEPPDALVLPVSSGGFANGVFRGVCDLLAAGEIGTAPRLYLVQPTAADPVTRAFETGSDEVEPLAGAGETVARSATPIRRAGTPRSRQRAKRGAPWSRSPTTRS
jgi:threonine synthase